MFKLFFQNWVVKVICFSGAALLWFYVSLTQNSVAKFPGAINIKAVNTTPGYIATYDQKSVEIRVMAEAVTWRKLSTESFSAYVDLSGYKAGTYETLVNVTSSVPGVTVVERKPDKILVSLEPVVTKEVVLNKKIEGNVADGYSVGDVTFSQEKVQITGAKSRLDNINEASLLVNLAGEQRSFDRTFKVAVFDEKGEVRDVEILPKESEANVSIVKASNNKTVGVRVMTTGQPKTGYYVSNISVSPPTVDVIGPQSTVNDLKYIETQPIELTNISTDFEKEVQLNFPSGVTITGSTPGAVKISLSFLASPITKELDVSKIIGLNLPGFKLKETLSSPIKVIASGPVDIVNALSSDDIQIVINFSDNSVTAPGVRNVDIAPKNFKSPDKISILSAVPSTVPVEIQPL